MLDSSYTWGRGKQGEGEGEGGHGTGSGGRGGTANRVRGADSHQYYKFGNLLIYFKTH